MDAGTHVERDDAARMADARFIRVRGTTAEWRCQSCDSWQEFDHEWCVQCAQPRRRFGSAQARATPGGVAGQGATTGLVAAGATSPSIGVARPGPTDIEEFAAAAGTTPLPPPSTSGDALYDRRGAVPTVAPVEMPRTRTDLPVAALAASMVLPGAGHALLGRVTAGLARMAVTVAWVVAAASWINHHALPAQRAAWVAVVGLALLWVLTLIDVVRIGRNESVQLLTAARLCVLVTVVTITLVIAPRVPIAAVGGL